MRNAHAGETLCSALLLRFHLHSNDKSLSPFAFATEAALDGSGPTHDPIDLLEILMIWDCNFRLVPAYLNYLR